MSKTKNRIASASLCTAALALAAPSHAEEQPLSLSISENYQHDSNVFRAPSYGDVSADWISNTGIGLNMNKPYGRQEYTANVSAGRSQYRDNAQLNNNYYDAKLGLSTEIGANLRASLNGESQQTIASFNNGLNNFTQKNPLHTTNLSAELQYGLYGRMSVYGGVNRAKSNYDLASTIYPDSLLTTSNAGLQYSPNGFMTFGLGVRHGSGGDGYGGHSDVLADAIKRNDLDLTANWALTGLSSLNARLSRTRVSHSDPTLQDFKGVTWQIGWNYTPTGKLSFNSFLERDTGNSNAPDIYSNTEFANYATEQTLTNVVSTSIGTNANWQVTGKIKLGAQLSYTRYNASTIANSTGIASELSPSYNRAGNSHYTNVGLSATYDILRHLSLSCGAQRSSRSGDGISSFGFKDTQYNCLGSYTLGGL